MVDEQAEHALGRLIEVVGDLRRYRDEVGAKPSVAIPARLGAEGYDAATAEQIARLSRFEFVDGGSPDGDVFATLPIPGGAVQVLRSGAFDPAAAEQRLAARREQLRGEIARAEAKLGNDRFVERAPAEVVEEERRKLEEYRRALDRLGR
jgi:valyl-tRNA synthetase